MWATVPLHKVAYLESGFGFPPRYQGDENQVFPFFRVSDMNIEGNEVFMCNHSNTVSTPMLKKLGAKAFPVGTVIFPKIGAAIATEKKRILTKPATYDNNVMGAVPKKCVNPKFLYYWFLQLKLADQANPGHVPSIRKSVMEQIPFSLPTPKEQSRIVELLDEADRLRKLRREADTKAARILPALFLKMFGDPTTNPMGWPMKPLGDLADQRPEYGANASACTLIDEMPRYVRITDIRDDGSLSDKKAVSLDSKDWQRYLLQEGDVLFARSGNTVGKTYIYRPDDGQCAFAGYLIRFQFRSGVVDPWFIFGLTRTTYYRGWVESHKRVAGQPNINGQEYASLLIPEPPKLLQERFGKLARATESVLASADRSAEQLESTFVTMLQHAFSGKLTAKWREGHMQELLAEMVQQARLLNLPLPQDPGAAP
jgi:type I restriction enzyme S subunit